MKRYEVFISSTLEDLEEHRKAAKDAALKAGFYPVLSDHFPAGGRPPLDECLDRARKCDLAIVIVAQRYGWVPDDQPGQEKKSITWLECQTIFNQKKKILPFLLDPKKENDWPVHFWDNYRAQAADADFESIQRDIRKLQEFKAWLGKNGILNHFDSPASLSEKIVHSLNEWRKQSEPGEKETDQNQSTARKREDASRYLRALKKSCARIDIRGLQVGKSKAHTFPIDEHYMTLTSVKLTGGDQELASRQEPGGAPREEQPLQMALESRRLVVTGDPGSGKTTFLRRVTFELARAQLHQQTPGMGLERELFPILFRIGDLDKFVRKHSHSPSAPVRDDAASWLPRFLAAQADQQETPLSLDFFRRRLKSESCLLMADGLDEAPDDERRIAIRRLIENASASFEECRIVVTSRPAAYQEEAVLDGWEQAEIDPLSPEAVETFLAKWCETVQEDAQRAAQQLTELREALQTLSEIRRMASNPVMLTALAVVHWNERRLPEQRADLYESVIRWLARSRPKTKGRLKAERCIELLQDLALEMQNHREGRQTQVPLHWAAEQLADQFAEASNPINEARQFLVKEENDSGIIVKAGNQLRYWHLTFQEYLAAKAIAAETESAQRRLLFSRNGYLYSSEWREMILLLSGVLYSQGKAKVDQFFETAVSEIDPKQGLKARAQCLGLLGAALRDLRPLDYRPPRAYEDLQTSVVAIFDPEESGRISVKDRISAADALHQPGDPRLADQPWVEVGSGSFWMGAQAEDPDGCNYDSEAQESESPVRKRDVASFKIGRYPVTVHDYLPFAAEGYDKESYWESGGFGQFKSPKKWEDQLRHPNRPVVGVSWYEAMAFCHFKGTRLPTEEEWEYATRGQDSRRYPWGEKEPKQDLANFGMNVRDTSPVGVYPRGATPEGVFDLAGNVWEWCQNRWRKTHDSDPDKALRVVRGGSWSDESWYLRCSCRIFYHPDGRDGSLGFRMVFPARTL